MKQSDRIRRAAILCCHCSRNAAYYLAGAECKANWAGEDFWSNTYSNFIDMAVIEWCKLFADEKGKHHWRKTVSDPSIFMVGLLGKLNISQSEFDAYIDKCKLYRDKFLAHLDEEARMHIPYLKLAIESTTFLFNLLKAENPQLLSDAPKEMASFHAERISYAK